MASNTRVTISVQRLPQPGDHFLHPRDAAGADQFLVDHQARGEENRIFGDLGVIRNVLDGGLQVGVLLGQHLQRGDGLLLHPVAGLTTRPQNLDMQRHPSSSVIDHLSLVIPPQSSAL
jgi:hypothetical protein